jgi:Phospholipase_D-nuclease N-terminal
MTRRQWRDLPRWQRTGAFVLAPVELVLTALAAVDLLRRPAGQIRGPKALWWPAILVQPAGPVAYLAWGRRGTVRAAAPRRR